MNINFKISNQQFIYILIIIILLSLLFSCNNSSIMEGLTPAQIQNLPETIYTNLNDMYSICDFPSGASFALGSNIEYINDTSDPSYILQMENIENFIMGVRSAGTIIEENLANILVDKPGFRIDFSNQKIIGQEISYNILPSNPKVNLYYTCDSAHTHDESTYMNALSTNINGTVPVINHGFMRKSILDACFNLLPLSAIIPGHTHSTSDLTNSASSASTGLAGSAAAASGGGGAAAASGGGAAAASGGGAAAASGGGGGGAAAASGGGGAAASGGGGGAAAASGGGSASSATGGSATNQNAINVNVDSSVTGGVPGNQSGSSLTPGSTTNIFNPPSGQTFNNPALLLQQPGNSVLTSNQPSIMQNMATGWNSLFGGGGSSSSLTMNNLTDLNTDSSTPSTMFTTSDGRQGLATTQNTINGIPSSHIPQGQEDLYILKSQVVPPVCPACPPVIVDKNTLNQDCPPCPPCARCPEPSFECKKVPNFNLGPQNTFLPRPVLNDFSTFGM